MLFAKSTPALVSRPGRAPLTSPPERTRHAVRPVHVEGKNEAPRLLPHRVLLTREVRWILDDFFNAGLHLGIRVAPAEEYLAQRRMQDRWFRDAIREAWSLEPSQVTELDQHLKATFDQAKANFVEALNASPKPVFHEGRWLQIASAEPMHRLISRFQQDEILDHGSQLLPASLWGEPPELIVATELQMSDSQEAVRALVGNPVDRTRLSLERVRRFLQPIEMADTAALTEDAGNGPGLLPAIRQIHAAHLKILLLVDPDLMERLQQEIQLEER